MDFRTIFRASAAPLALMTALALGACGRSSTLQAAAAPAAAAPDPGYRAPPELKGVSRAAGGGVSLSGQAAPSSTVRMVSAAGAQVQAAADGAGAWTASLGPVSAPTLYRLAEEVGGHRVEAEGLVAVLPGAPTVALLRAGYGAEVQDPGQEAPKILAVDYDGGGGAVVSGRATASATVRIMVDGQLAIEGAAGPDGRFSLTLPKPLTPGRRRLQVLMPQGPTLLATAETVIAVTPPAVPKTGSYQASSQPYGWRIDWTTAGGGAQTTLLPTAPAG